MSVSAPLGHSDIKRYRENGYLVLRRAVSRQSCDQLRIALLERAQHKGCTVSVPREKTFPEPAKYTLAANDWADSDLAFIAEHPAIIDAVEAVLGEPPVLTAYVAYIRPPGDTGSRAHCDHKRWRPVGSSLNWCFAIVALTDFTTDVGALRVSPGSHKLIRPLASTGERVVSVTPPDKQQLAPFVDAELRQGDLLLMHGNTWHEAPANKSEQFRVGVFNKYAAFNAPPAAGYFKWSDAVYDCLGERGKRLLAVHSDRALHSTRLVLERMCESGAQVLLIGNDDEGWSLPGGRVDTQRNRALEVGLDGAWDSGNLIGALEELCAEQLGSTPRWMSYVADYEESEHLCRVYGSTDTEPLALASLPETVRWFPVAALGDVRTECPYLTRAVEAWLDESDQVVRGKGKSEQRCLPTDGLNQYLD